MAHLYDLSWYTTIMGTCRHHQPLLYSNNLRSQPDLPHDALVRIDDTETMPSTSNWSLIHQSGVKILLHQHHSKSSKRFVMRDVTLRTFTLILLLLEQILRGVGQYNASDIIMFTRTSSASPASCCSTNITSISLRCLCNAASFWLRMAVSCVSAACCYADQGQTAYSCARCWGKLTSSWFFISSSSGCDLRFVPRPVYKYWNTIHVTRVLRSWLLASCGIPRPGLILSLQSCVATVVARPQAWLLSETCHHSFMGKILARKERTYRRICATFSR